MKIIEKRKLTTSDWIGIAVMAAGIILAREWAHLF